MQQYFSRLVLLFVSFVQVRGAFEKLYTFFAGELETAAQQGDTPLQFALMDAWGVEMHEEDHDLLARVRIFNILQVEVIHRRRLPAYYDESYRRVAVIGM